MVENINFKIDNFEKIYSKIKDYRDILNLEDVEEIKSFSENIRSKIEDAVETERLLRIGIVGEVKAGKSTFLNTLIFDGKQVLPQAATPMTSALTRIVYSSELRAEVEFYNKKDWDTVEAYADEYKNQYNKLTEEFIQMKESQSMNPFINKNKNIQNKKLNINKLELKKYIDSKISKQSEACYQLVEMLNNSRIDKYDCMEREVQIIEGISTVEDLMGKLEDYVGAEGSYTPIVKSTKIFLNFENLRGIEIIDTPGTNDPIVSRSMATRKYLSNCDVVFLLSYAGQFMKSQDVQFLSQTLPSEGINNGIIVGSKFDSVLLDDNSSGNDFVKAIKLTSSKLSKHAQSIIEKELESDKSNKVIKLIKESLPPIYISPMAYIISKKDRKELTEKEEHVIRRLETRFKGFNFDNKILSEFSNIDRVKTKELQNIIKNKENILKEKIESTIVGQIKKVRDLIVNLQKDVDIKLDSLVNGDKKKLDDTLSSLKKQSSKIEDRIVNIFENEFIEIKRLIRELQLDIKSKYKEYDKLYIDKKTSTSTSTSRGGLLWLKKTTTTKKTTSYEAKIKDAVDNIRDYSIDIEKYALKDFNSIVDIKRIKDKLRKTIIEELNLNNVETDEEHILYSIDSNLKRLTIPNLVIDINLYESMIGNEFSGSIVKDEDIHELEAKQREVLVNISIDVEQKLSGICKEIEKEFLNYSNSFINKVVYSLEKDVKNIKSQLENKEEYMRKYNEVGILLKDIKRNLIVD